MGSIFDFPPVTMAKDNDDASLSSSSSGSTPTALPIMALRHKIVEKIQENRVTLIVGETGCGKSSQVPLFLLEENMEPILCTQPRRFAVVTIARVVAKALNGEVGGEVGYHIGHSNVTNITSARSKIVFKTAGVLLEQMRDKGVAALKYKVIILDEVHERSVESDLVLACVKQFMMKTRDLRLVLMSATADIGRYRDYFKDLGRGERVEVIGIPSAPQHSIFQRKVLYLEQIAELLGIIPEDSKSLSSNYCGGSDRHADAALKPQAHLLIHKLIMYIHQNEPDTQKSILVFLPTYFSLEQQWILLKPLSSLFKVHILHRSIDIDQALLAMKVWKSHRKVILATNIAESSVTIPGVAFVIDSCRSLQVLWDNTRKSDTSELVWVSKSQADQRKGRTGRTCDGQIYRLVTIKFYNSLEDYEYPAISRLSLRQQVLMICCAESKAISDPKVMLQKVLDPPESETVQEALDLLVRIRALEQRPTHRARYEPTFYGRLLDHLPMSFDASVFALKFGEIGLLREGILIGILMDIQPLPILQPFGNPALFEEYVGNFFEGESGNSLPSGKRETTLIGNLCAFQFWQRAFKDVLRLERLKDIIKVDKPKTSPLVISKFEEEWCSYHNIVQTSLHNLSEIYEDAISGVHCYRPAFLSANELPTYTEPNFFKHSCLLQSDLAREMDALNLEDESSNLVTDKRKCFARPYVPPSDFQALTVYENFTIIIKEVRVQYTEETRKQNGNVNDVAQDGMEAPLCRYFLSGSCTRGDRCIFSHSLQAKRPICNFFFTLQGCRNGASCFFSHDDGPSAASVTASVHQEDKAAASYSLTQFLHNIVDAHLLVLNDRDLRFTSNLSYNFHHAKIFATTPRQSSTGLVSSSKNVKYLTNFGNPCDVFIETRGENPIPWELVQTVLLFVETDAIESDTQHHLIQNFFELLTIRVLAENLCKMRVIITMNNLRFAKLQVEKLARECFFFLNESFPFDEFTFGEISDPISIRRPAQVSACISYVFNMHPPAEIVSVDCAVELRKSLLSKNKRN